MTRTVLRRNVWWVALFAIAMAYLESAVVVYLRDLYDIEDIATDIPAFERTTGYIEIGREAATMFMLLFVGWIAGRNFQTRIAFAFLAFGVWDIFYYFWLWVFIGWPTSPFDLDLLFLIPLPWWGPVLSPILIAFLMVGGGVAAVIRDEAGHVVRPQWQDWTALVLGTLIVLYTFMADGLAAMPVGPEDLAEVQPTDFKWLVYLVGFALMNMAVWRPILTPRINYGASVASGL